MTICVWVGGLGGGDSELYQDELLLSGGKLSKEEKKRQKKKFQKRVAVHRVLLKLRSLSWFTDGRLQRSIVSVSAQLAAAAAAAATSTA